MTSCTAADQTEIRDLTARFTDAVNRRAPEELAALFTEQGEWHVPGVPAATGREAIAAVLATLLDGFPHLIQLTHSGHVDVSGDTATATWYITESGFPGAYAADRARPADGWRFARRSVAFLQRTRSEAKTRWYPHPRAAG